MLSIEDRHFKIIKDILGKYPYTFYAFGSRTKKPKKLSDLDLCFFEPIPGKVRSHIDEDFEESDLPYTVDVVDWQTCDTSFRALIQKDLVCIQAGTLLLKIEKNAFEHFTYLPKILGFNVSETAHNTMINCGLGSSMFNIVCRTQLQENSSQKSIEDIIHAFNNQPFAWWLGPSSTPLHLGTLLEKNGFRIETNEYAMLCNLDQFNLEKNSSPSIDIYAISTLQGLQDFIAALERYDTSVRIFFEKIKNLTHHSLQNFFVGYEKNEPVVIGMLYFGEDTAGIFSLLTQEDKRGKGYGTSMMRYLMAYAKERGFAYASLSASSDEGIRIYEKLGFKTMGQFKCYEWSR